MTLFTSANVRLLLILAVAAVATHRAWRNRSRRGARPLAGYTLVLAMIASSHLLAHLTPDRFALVFVKLRWLGLIALPFTLSAFALSYTGRENLLTRRGVAAIFALPAFVALFLFTPDLTGLAGVRTGSAAVATFLDERGAPFVLVLGSAYGALLVASGLLVHYSYQVNELFRRTGLAIVAGITVMWVATLVEGFGVVSEWHVHWVQNGFLFMGVVFLWAVFRGGLTELTPIAHSTTIYNLDTGVLVTDADRRLVDINPAAKRLLGYDEDTKLVGQPVAEALSGHETLRELVRSGDDGEVELDIDTGHCVVSVDPNPLTNAAGDTVGNAVLLTDITQQHRQREQLERQNERLERFGNTVSHDLRNPLNVAQGRVELERQDRESDNLAAASDALDRMETLVDELYSLAQHRQSALETESVTLSSLVERSWRMVEAPDTDLAVEDDLTFTADPDRVLQLLENLFRNAVEHGGPDISIRVGTIEEDGFYVADDGTGVPEEERTEVFDSGYSTASNGTGFGLAIVSEIVEAHGWTIRVVWSDSGGARFEITGLDRSSESG